MPMLGSVAHGFAELAESRGETNRAEELWDLGARLGANLDVLFGSTLLTRPRSAAENTARAARLARARTISVADTVTRLATLIGQD
jgi:hypothetical protein